MGEGREGQYCSNRQCDSCDRQRQKLAIESALMSDESSRCWSCSCGWIGCYTQADLAEFGEPPECQKCYRERLGVCEPPAIAALSTPSTVSNAREILAAAYEDEGMSESLAIWRELGDSPFEIAALRAIESALKAGGGGDGEEKSND